MTDEFLDSGTLNSRELDAIYAINRVVTRATELDASLDEIIGIAREVFIFDNVVLYIQQESDSLEPSYARAIGRGRGSRRPRPQRKDPPTAVTLTIPSRAARGCASRTGPECERRQGLHTGLPRG